MSSHDSTSNSEAELSIIDEKNKAKGELCSQGPTNEPRRRNFSTIRKSRIWIAAIISLGLVVTFVTAVLITTSGSEIDEKFPNDRCNSFYKFSCQLWNEQNPRPQWITKWDVFSALSRKSNEVVLELLVEPLQHDDIDGVRQAKGFYKKCLSYYGEETNHTRKIYSSIYGMPLVRETEAGNVNHPPTNELCSQLVKRQFTSIVVHKYIMQKYPDMDQFEKIKAEVQQMFDNIKMVFENADVPFFSKLANNTKVCIGFPDWMKNSTQVQSKYDGFLLDKDESFDMQLMKTFMWKIIQEFMVFIKSTNSTECWKYPSDIEYEADTTRTAISTLNNSSILIYIPLGLLEPPFFQLHQSKAMNYGSLGQIIGHELAHAYLGTDWKESTDESSQSLRECFKQQYSAFTAGDSIALNGELTLDENLPDNLGLLASFIAYSKIDENQHTTENMTDEEVSEPHGNQTNELPSNQLTDDQMFFLSFSQTWCESNSKKHMETKMRESQHAPGIFRALGTLRNSNEFARSWNCSYSNRPKSCQSLLTKTLARGI